MPLLKNYPLAGIAFYPDHDEDMTTLISSNERAMYTAGNSGKNQFLTKCD